MFAKPKVVVLGGGFGGLETAFYLRHKLGDRVELTLVSDTKSFIFRPNTIYIPFGADPAHSLLPLSRPLQRKNIHFVHGIALEVEPVARRVDTSRGPIYYDYLVIATGAGMQPEEIAGFKTHVNPIWSPQQLVRLGEGLGRVIAAARAGQKQRLMFLAPPHHPCLAPLYELAFMTETWLNDRGVRDQVEFSWVTGEDSFFEVYGPRSHRLVAEEFERRHIDGLTGLRVIGVEPGRVSFANRCSLAFDFLIGTPPMVAMQRYPGLAENGQGFLQVEAESRRVKGQERIFAVGDAAAFPLKQAYLALLQADAAADHIAAELLGVQPEIQFHPIAMYVLEQFDKAAYVQAQFKYTEGADGGFVVDPETPQQYQVGVSPLWRVGKKVMGVYLPWRFGNGEPFYTGLAWGGVRAGLKIAKSVLAS